MGFGQEMFSENAKNDYFDQKVKYGKIFTIFDLWYSILFSN